MSNVSLSVHYVCCLLTDCLVVQNILVDRQCQCREAQEEVPTRDLFLCPHYDDSGYGVFISDFDSALQVDRGQEKLKRSKLYCHPIKYSVHGTPGCRPPEVIEGTVVLYMMHVLS